MNDAGHSLGARDLHSARLFPRRSGLGIALAIGACCAACQAIPAQWLHIDWGRSSAATTRQPPPGVAVAAQPARRLLVTPDEDQSGSRLVVLWVRIENAGSEVISLNPENAELVFADGTATVALDQERAVALIERVDVAPTDEAAADYPDLWTIARRPDQQQGLKRQLSEGLLGARVLGTEAVEGYLVFDTKQRTSSLDGATLQLTLTSQSDGTPWQVPYRFASAPPAAASYQQQP